MTVKKNVLKEPGHPDFLRGVRELIELAFGRRNNRQEPVPELGASDLTASPTAADYNKLLRDVQMLRAYVAALRDRFNDD